MKVLIFFLIELFNFVTFWFETIYRGYRKERSSNSFGERQWHRWVVSNLCSAFAFQAHVVALSRGSACRAIASTGRRNVMSDVMSDLDVRWCKYRIKCMKTRMVRMEIWGMYSEYVTWHTRGTPETYKRLAAVTAEEIRTSLFIFPKDWNGYYIY